MAELVPVVPRIFNHKIGNRPVSVIPVVDAARLIGYPYRTVYALIKRNWTLFRGLTVTVTVTVRRQRRRRDGSVYWSVRQQQVDALTDLGFVALVFRVCAVRIKDPAKLEHIARVQKHVLAKMRAVQEHRCPPSDQALTFEEAACLPRNAFRGALLRQHAEERSWSLHKTRERAREARMVAGLPAHTWHREARKRCLAYLETHPGAPLLKLMEIAGEPITMPTACRIRQHWRRTRAALAEPRLFAPITPTPLTPNPAA